MIQNIILLLLLLNSFNSRDKDNFTLFLAKFKDVKQPIVMDESFFNLNLIVSNSNPLDTNLISSYITDNKDLAEGVSLYDVYHFYPIIKFEISTSLIGVIYKKQGISGGFEDQYFMNIYSVNGRKKSELLIGKYVSDCSFKELVTSEIKENKIHKVHMYFNGDCDEDTYLEEIDMRTDIYMKIDTSEGIIMQLHKTQ